MRSAQPPLPSSIQPQAGHQPGPHSGPHVESLSRHDQGPVTHAQSSALDEPQPAVTPCSVEATCQRLRVLTFNVNGLRPCSAKFGGLPAMLNALGADVVCIQETKLRRVDLDRDLALVQGWESFFAFTRGNTGYSGTATFCRRGATFPVKGEEGLTGVLERQPAQRSLVLQDPMWEGQTVEDLVALDQEGRVVITDHGSFVLFNVYGVAITSVERSEERLAYKLALNKAVEARIRRYLAENRRVLLVGDLNICPRPCDSCEPGDVADWFNTKSRQFLYELSWDGPAPGGPLVDTFRLFHRNRVDAYTHWSTVSSARTHNWGTRLDLLLAAGPGEVVGEAAREAVDGWVVDGDIMPEFLGSDHSPAWVDLVFSQPGPCVVDVLQPGQQGVRGAPPAPPGSSRHLFDAVKQVRLTDLFKRQDSSAGSATPTPPTLREPHAATQLQCTELQGSSIELGQHLGPDGARSAARDGLGSGQHIPASPEIGRQSYTNGIGSGGWRGVRAKAGSKGGMQSGPRLKQAKLTGFLLKPAGAGPVSQGPGQEMQSSQGMGNYMHGSQGIGEPMHGSQGMGQPMQSSQSMGQSIQGSQRVGQPMHGSQGMGNLMQGSQDVGQPMQGSQGLGNNWSREDNSQGLGALQEDPSRGHAMQNSQNIGVASPKGQTGLGVYQGSSWHTGQGSTCLAGIQRSGSAAGQQPHPPHCIQQPHQLHPPHFPQEPQQQPHPVQLLQLPSSLPAQPDPPGPYGPGSQVPVQADQMLQQGGEGEGAPKSGRVEAAAVWAAIQDRMKAPLCSGHKEPTVIRQVKKAGPTFGRLFYVCSRPDGPVPVGRCDFFAWGDSRTGVPSTSGGAPGQAAKRHKHL